MSSTAKYPPPVSTSCEQQPVPPDTQQPSDDEPKPRRKKKNIVICCDGTGNNFTSPNPIAGRKRTGENSNVIKLYTALTIDNDQVGYYHPGVGTMGAPNANHWFTRLWSKIKGLAFGAGFRDNVFDAYRFLMEAYDENGGNPEDQDDVYIFGFSRGAYTARALAGLLDAYGLLCRGNEGHLPYAWRMYVAQHEDRDANEVTPNRSFKATFSHPNFKIHFLGVFDTVSSVGWISEPLRLFNVAVNHSLKIGRHAISIDEHRCFFQDNLWGQSIAGQDIVQVWFAGVHSDVGGSYSQPQAGLSNLTLCWMLKEAETAGIRLDPNRRLQIFGHVPTHPAKPVDPDLTYNAPTDARLHVSLKGGWNIPEIVPRKYYDMDDGKETVLVPLWKRWRKIPAGSLVHQSVMTRFETVPDYVPKNITREELTQPDTASALDERALAMPSMLAGKKPPTHEEIVSTPTPPAADGTIYYRFSPQNRPEPSTLKRIWEWVLVGIFFVLDLALLYLVLWCLGWTAMKTVKLLLPYALRLHPLKWYILIVGILCAVFWIRKLLVGKRGRFLNHAPPAASGTLPPPAGQRE